MTEYKTPGVYVKEISKFPPSVAGVATAIPAFIGYTEKLQFDKNNKPKAVKIKSLLDYENLFGEGPKLELDDNGELLNHNFVLYDSIRLFYDNGGGTCYVVSIGNYEWGNFDAGQYENGLEPLEKVDEVTLLIAPDAAMLLDKAQLGTLHKAMLKQCDKLGDRFAILDAKMANSLDTDLENFRSEVGNNFLSYGAAYYPFLSTTYTKDIGFDEMLKIKKIEDEAKKISLYNDYYTKTDEELAFGIVQETLKKTYDTALAVAIENKAKEIGIIQIYERIWELEKTEEVKNHKENEAKIEKLNRQIISLEGADRNAAIQEKSELEEANQEIEKSENYTSYDAALKEKDTKEKELKDFENDSDEKKRVNELEKFSMNADEELLYSDAIITTIENNIGKEVYNAIRAEIENIRPNVKAEVKTKKPLMAKAFAAQIDGYAEELAKLQAKASIIPPSGAIAGIYAAIDGSKGVWQAPANVSIAAVANVTETISDNDQEDMNVDTEAGKSVNAIRFFTGKGILVWGARTLDGNSNEWKYVPVRRLFNYIEESVQKSTNWAVFQPNDANTWVKIQCQIENFLNNLWRDGALAGSTPDKAYYVKVGQDVTMTADDINNGYLIVEIGIAAVRPAEFIVLKFSHKVQEV